MLADRLVWSYYLGMDQVTGKTTVRQRLVETATRLFYENGYRATGINEVIREAGIAKASFYAHFKTKEDLLVTCLEQRHNQMMAQVQAFIADARSPAERVRRLFVWLGDPQSCGSRGCPYLNMASEFQDAGSRVREVVRWHKCSFRNMLRDILALHFMGKNKTTEQVEQAAEELYLLLEGALAASPVHCCSWPVETALRIAEDRFQLGG